MENFGKKGERVEVGGYLCNSIFLNMREYASRDFTHFFSILESMPAGILPHSSIYGHVVISHRRLRSSLQPLDFWVEYREKTCFWVELRFPDVAGGVSDVFHVPAGVTPHF